MRANFYVNTLTECFLSKSCIFCNVYFNELQIMSVKGNKTNYNSKVGFSYNKGILMQNCTAISTFLNLFILVFNFTEP